MKVIIKSIEAVLVDTSTPEGSSCIIKSWLCKYEVRFPPKNITKVEGALEIIENRNEGLYIDPNDIIERLKTLYKEVNERIQHPL